MTKSGVKNLGFVPRVCMDSAGKHLVNNKLPDTFFADKADFQFKICKKVSGNLKLKEPNICLDSESRSAFLSFDAIDVAINIYWHLNFL